MAVGSFGGGHIYHTTNGGGSWTDISGNLPDEPFNAIKVDPAAGTLFAGGDDGLYLSFNAGGSWTKAGIPNAQVTDLAISAGAGIVAAGTHGRGVFEAALQITSTAPVITSALTDGGQVAQVFSYQIAATNSPTSYSAAPLPAGLSINTGTGLISGTPTTAGTYAITLNATNAGGTGTVTLVLTITSDPTVFAPVITSATTDGGLVGQIFTYQITASNAPTGYAASSLPTGLSLDTITGLISGTPRTAGTFTINLSAFNAGGSGTAILTLTVTADPTVAAPVIIGALSVPGQVGQPLTYQITASNGPTSYAAIPLPAGLNLEPATGVLTGTPTTAGTFSVDLSATNAGGTGTAALTITITPAVPTVTLAATTPTVTAGSGDPGLFTLNLSAVQDHDVIVNITIKGSAVNGGDYVLLKTAKKIKAGKTSKPIKIVPLGEGAGPGVKRVVTLLLAPGNGYTVGTTDKVKVKIFGQ